MTRTLLTAVFLTLFSQTAWAETVTVSLFCEGEFVSQRQIPPSATWHPAGKRPYSERVTIENNIWNSQQLMVSDALIYLPSGKSPVLDAKGTKLTKFSLDRLTGKLSIVYSTKNAGMAYKITLNAKCKKLNPKKKLF